MKTMLGVLIPIGVPMEAWPKVGLSMLLMDSGHMTIIVS